MHWRVRIDEHDTVLGPFLADKKPASPEARARALKAATDAMASALPGGEEIVNALGGDGPAAAVGDGSTAAIAGGTPEELGVGTPEELGDGASPELEEAAVARMLDAGDHED